MPTKNQDSAHKQGGEQISPTFLLPDHRQQWTAQERKAFEDWWNGPTKQWPPGLLQTTISQASAALRKTGEVLQRLAKRATKKRVG